MLKKFIVIVLILSLLLVPGCDNRSADEFYESAVQYAANGDYSKAAADYVRAYQIDKGMVAAYLGAIDAYKSLRIEFRIIECLTLLIENCPNNPIGYITAAEYYLDQNDLNTALSYCFMQIDAIPDTIDGYMLATKIYYDSYSYEDALIYANQLVTLFPDEFDGYCYAIQSYNLLSKNTEAIALSKKMIKVFPDEVIPYVFLGYILIEETEYTKATAALDSCPDKTDNRITSLKKVIRGKEVIYLADIALEEALRSYLDRKDGDILLEDVFDIFYLDIVGGRNPKVVFDDIAAPLDITVEMLDDLKYFESLVGLKIRSLEFEDFSPIRNLQDLCILNLEGTNVSSLSFLVDIPYLVSLTITNGNLKAVSPISMLKYLEELTLDNNEIDTLFNFSELGSLSKLSLSNNMLSDITNIAVASRLTSLDLSNNPDISSVEALASLSSLSYLNLLGCEVEDIKYVLSVPNLIYG